MNFKKMILNINGAERMFICDPAKDTLAAVLRRLGLTGTKVGCGTGVCGACSVIVNGKVVRSCVQKISKLKDLDEILTIEGIGTPRNPHPLQVAFMGSGAVQCGFCSPGFIVSAYALLESNPNPTREEVRDWFQKHRNVCRCTGYRQIVDGVMEAAKIMRGEITCEEVTGKYKNEESYYGKGLIRPSALSKVCGVADYGDDVELKMPDGTLHAVLVQPKVTHHARILKIHTEEASKMEGVYQVITARDIPGGNLLNFFPVSKRTKAAKPSHFLLAEDKIFNYGDVIALVVADTVSNARAAAEKVRMDYEELPAYLNLLDAVMPDAVRVHEDTDNIFTMQPYLKGEEDTASLFGDAPHVVRGSFYAAREPHMSIEGDTVQAYYDEDGLLTVHCKAQGVYSIKANVAKAVGLPAEQVRIVENPTGGSFGWAVAAGTPALVGIATYVTGRPVALSIRYDEFMAISGKRSAAYTNAGLACDENGKILAVEFETAFDHGAYEELADHLIIRAGRFMFFPYHVPNVAGITKAVNTNHCFGTAYRGYGSPQVYTASEALMDMMAEKIGMDPFEFRYRNIAREGELALGGKPYKQYPMEKMMERMRPLYERAVKEAKEKDTPEKKRGVGLAWGGYVVTGGAMDVCTVALELNPDNTISKYDTWQDQGQGGDIGSLMVTLEALKPLGIKPEQVQLIQNDSKYCPDSGLSASSRSHYMNGNATILAANELMAAMRKEDGSYRTYEEMVAADIPTKYEGKYSNASVSGLFEVDPNTGAADPNPTYTYALFMAEVEVDVNTGKTTVLRFTSVDDVGVIGNIQAVDGQANGGISHSIGYALSENYQDVKKHNNIYGAGVPYIKDIPDEIQLIHNCTYRETGPFGSAGASEAFQSSGHVAVINAIYNACQVRIFELPAYPEKVKAGLEQLKKGEAVASPKPYYLGPDLYESLEYVKNNPV